MPVITLPDSTQKSFEQPVTAHEVAASIGARLAKDALAARVDGALVDTSYKIEHDCEFSIITAKDEAGVEVLRHSCAHLMAQAVQRLFPKAQVTIGPVITDGFYYDFAFHRSFTPEDLEAIEQQMQAIVAEKLEVSRFLLSRDEAVELFRKKGEDYKVEIIQAIPSNEPLSFYQQGEFVDLCRGPHVPNTGCFKAFKLTKLAGAYWRGDSNNEMLQRIYGTAWPDQKSLAAYLFRIEEAEKRDHRKIGKKLELFHVQEEAPGMIFWHPRGWALYKVVEQYIRDKLAANGYEEISTPQVVGRELWEQSGHWDKFRQNMYDLEIDGRNFAIKPMNCPCHVQIYNQGLRSHKELPLRLAEFGCCHRNEPSGTLHGLMRARSFVQDDAHIFCTEGQLQQEVASFLQLLFEVYKDFGFPEVEIRLSTRPEARVGSDELWDKAEAALEQALVEAKLEFIPCPGEGAFYGPKLEFSLRDCLGRVWQCGTIQVDFSMPERLGAVYVAEDSSRQTPVMLHRAILGSLERFIGILLEEHAGSMPVWLAPVQVAVLSLSRSQEQYCQNLVEKLQKLNIRVVGDLRNQKIGFKIREHSIQRVPYLLVIGEREMENEAVSVRTREGWDKGAMPLDKFVKILNDDIAKRGRVSH